MRILRRGARSEATEPTGEDVEPTGDDVEPTGDDVEDEETVRLSVAAVRAAVAAPHPPADPEVPAPESTAKPAKSAKAAQPAESAKADESESTGEAAAPESTGATLAPAGSSAPAARAKAAESAAPGGSGATAVSVGDDRSVRLARRRFVRRRWARRWLAWRRILVPVVVLALVAAVVWLVFFSSVLAVSGVQVVGARLLSPTSVRAAAAVPTGRPLATADLDAISSRVRRLPAVKSVDVSRAWPDRVRVDVTERVAVAVVQPAAVGGRLRGMDASGVLFRDYAKRPAMLPVIRRTATTDTDALAEAAIVAGSLPPDLARRVASVSVATVDRISLDLRSGRTVLWGSSADSADKAEVLTALLGQKARAYDVSVPGQPVITP